jgi:hypothetical protein
MIVDSLGVTGYFIDVKYRLFNNKTTMATRQWGSGAEKANRLCNGECSQTMNERRDSQRVPVVIDAVLNYQAQVMVCTVRDISLNGAFIEGMPQGLPYFNAPVELGITLTAGGETKQHRIPAKIRRIADNGAGVSFGDVGMDAYFSLVNLVYNA